MSNSLYKYWSYTLKDGEELMLEQPPKHDTIITQVALANPENNNKRITCSVFVETLQIDKPQIDNDFQSVTYESVIASFCPYDQPTKQVSLGFAETDICYIKAKGGSLIVSGYIMPSKVNLGSL